MSEYTISRDDGAADVFALQDALNVLKASALWDSPTAKRLLDLRRSIEEQVKPKVTEPTEWGSVVRARLASFEAEVFTPPFRWHRLGAVGGTWVSEPADDLGTRYYGDWSHLRNVEVLRVGIGEPSDEEQAAAKYETTVALADAYSRGYHDGFESNIPSPVDRSNINSAIQDAMTQIIAREGRLLGVGYAHELADAVMKVLAQPTDEWHRLEVANAQTEAYTKGAEDFAAKVRREIATLRAKVVTGPEKRTCDDLLALVGILQGLS